MLARQPANYVNAIKEARGGKMSKTFKQSVLAMQEKIQGRLKQENGEVYVRATQEADAALWEVRAPQFKCGESIRRKRCPIGSITP